MQHSLLGRGISSSFGPIVEERANALVKPVVHYYYYQVVGIRRHNHLGEEAAHINTKSHECNDLIQNEDTLCCYQDYPYVHA